MNTYKYYLLNKATGWYYYLDNSGVVKQQQTPVALSSSVDNWSEGTTKIERRHEYNTLQRSISVGLRFVEDGAAILRDLFFSDLFYEAELLFIQVKYTTI